MRVETEASGQFLNRRIAQHRLVVADDDRNLIDGNLKVIKKILIAGIDVEIDVGVGMSVASEKLAQTQRGGRVARAQQDHISLAAVNQFDTAQDESAHEDLAQFRISGNQGPQILAAHSFPGIRRPR